MNVSLALNIEGVKRMKEKRLDLYAAVLIFMVGVFIFANSFSIHTLTNMTIGPDFMPKVVGCGLMMLSVILGIQALRAVKLKDFDKGDDEQDEDPLISKRFIATVAVIFGYFILLKPLGYLISTFLYTFCHFMLLTDRNDWKRKWLFCIILSAVISAATYAVFRLGFNLMLPEGILR